MSAGFHHKIEDLNKHMPDMFLEFLFYPLVVQSCSHFDEIVMFVTNSLWLNDGDIVITAGVSYLSDGQKVKLLEQKVDIFN